MCGILLVIFTGYFLGHKARQRRKGKQVPLQLDETETATVSFDGNEMSTINGVDRTVEENSHFVAVQDEEPLVRDSDDEYEHPQT